MRITERHLRRIIRRELQLETVGLGLALADMMLPDEYQGLLNPLSEEYLFNPASALYKYRNDPAVQRETDAVMNRVDDIADKAQVGLTALAGALAIPAPPAAAAVAALAGIVGGSANFAQFLLAAAKGDKSTAAANLAETALDLAIGSVGEQLLLKLGEKLGIRIAMASMNRLARLVAKAGDIAHLRAFVAATSTSNAVALGALSAVITYTGNQMKAFAAAYDGTADTSEIIRQADNLIEAASQIQDGIDPEADNDENYR